MCLHILTGMYNKKGILIPVRLQQGKEKILDFPLGLLVKHYK